MVTISIRVRNDDDIKWLLERLAMLVAGTTAVVQLKPGHWSLDTSREWTLTQSREQHEVYTLVGKKVIPDNAAALRHSIGFLVGVEIVG